MESVYFGGLTPYRPVGYAGRMTTYAEEAAFYAADERRSAEYDAAEGRDAYMTEEFGEDWRERLDPERYVPEGEVDDHDEFRDAWNWWEDRLRREWA